MIQIREEFNVEEKKSYSPPTLQPGWNFPHFLFFLLWTLPLGKIWSAFQSFIETPPIQRIKLLNTFFKKFWQLGQFWILSEYHLHFLTCIFGSLGFSYLRNWVHKWTLYNTCGFRMKKELDELAHSRLFSKMCFSFATLKSFQTDWQSDPLLKTLLQMPTSSKTDYVGMNWSESYLSCMIKLQQKDISLIYGNNFL